MNVEELTSRYKSLMINLVIFFILLYISSRIYQAQNKKFHALENNKAVETEKIEILKNLGKLQEEFNGYKQFINQKDPNQLSDTITTIARNTQAKIISFRPLAEENLPMYTKYSFDVKVEVSSYHALGRFISSLESHPFIFSIDLTRISAQAAEKEKMRLNVDLKISTIYLRN